MNQEVASLRSANQQQVQETPAARDAALCARYFAKHQAAYSREVIGGAVVERLVWRQPGTSFHYVEYLCLAGARLFVSGDLGDAIYTTGAQDLSWWARCDLRYFAGKCDASEYGRGYRAWDDDKARARLAEDVAQMRADGEVVDDDLVHDASSAAEDEQEWNSFLREHGEELFGADFWESAPNYGRAIHERCALHLLGLKAALAQLAAATPAPSAVEVTAQTDMIATPGDDFDGSRSTPHAAQPVPA
jgi:hypothetical protein